MQDRNLLLRRKTADSEQSQSFHASPALRSPSTRRGGSLQGGAALWHVEAGQIDALMLQQPDLARDAAGVAG